MTALTLGATVLTPRGRLATVVRIVRGACFTHHYVTGSTVPFNESQLRPMADESKEITPMSNADVTAMLRAGRRGE